jgi:hypothetical protein
MAALTFAGISIVALILAGFVAFMFIGRGAGRMSDERRD